MGRYIERAESTARLLLITESFAAEGVEEEAWQALLHVLFQYEAFMETRKKPTPENIAKFFLTQKSSMSSVAAQIHMVKENARSLRHLFSTEAWVQISQFNDYIESLPGKSVALAKLPQICEEIRARCYQHYGVLEATCYRDETWLFNRIGAALERADQMTRLVDIKYFQIDTADDQALTPPDAAWWNSLLRSASGYHAFRRRHSFNPAITEFAAFLLFDEDFPRSVCASANDVFDCLNELAGDYGAAPDEALIMARRALYDVLTGERPALSSTGLHGYLDDVQTKLNALSVAVGRRYFTAG